MTEDDWTSLSTASDGVTVPPGPSPFRVVYVRGTLNNGAPANAFLVLGDSDGTVRRAIPASRNAVRAQPNQLSYVAEYDMRFTGGILTNGVRAQMCEGPDFSAPFANSETTMIYNPNPE